MRIQGFSTGTVRLKHAFLYASTGPARQVRLFLPGPLSDPMPIHLWVVEHEGRRILVDTGETAAVRDLPFAKFNVGADQELPGVLAAAGLTLDDIDTVVLTHLHGDHMDGAVHLGDRPVLVHGPELASSRTAAARFFQHVLRQPIPEGVRFESFTLDAGPVGAFPASRALTDDGRVLVVPTPGHTPGHVSILCVDDEGRHVLLAGDASDSLEQLHARRPDAVALKPKVHVETLERILTHAEEHPLVFLPSHDPESLSRLAAGATV